MSLTLGLDIAFAVLLVITIGYAIQLNRKLGNLRQHKEDLEKLAMTFAQSTTRADESIQCLKKSTDDLQRGIDKAQGLRDDLTFLIDRGMATADRLEEGVRGARLKTDEIGSGFPKNPVETVEPKSNAKAARRDPTTGINIVGGTDADGGGEDDLARQKSQAEKDLIDALRQVR